MAKFCNKCNSSIEEGGSFCTQCGSNDIRDDSIIPTAPVEVPTIPTPEENKSSFGDLPDFMGGSTETETTPIPTSPNPTAAVTTTPIVPQVVAENTPSIPSDEEEKEKSKLLFIIIGVIGVILIIAGIIVLLIGGNKKESPTNTTPGNPNIEDTSNFFTPENSFRVGTKDFGYVSIPNTWVKFVDPNSTSSLQYSDGHGWIVTLFSLKTSDKKAETWSNQVYNSLKEEGTTKLETTKTKIYNYDAIGVNCYYPSDNIYLSTWFFEDNKGITHYLALEGPEKDGDNYKIIYSYKDNE